VVYYTTEFCLFFTWPYPFFFCSLHFRQWQHMCSKRWPRRAVCLCVIVSGCMWVCARVVCSHVTTIKPSARVWTSRVRARTKIKVWFGSRQEWPSDILNSKRVLFFFIFYIYDGRRWYTDLFWQIFTKLVEKENVQTFLWVRVERVYLPACPPTSPTYPVMLVLSLSLFFSPFRGRRFGYV